MVCGVLKESGDSELEDLGLRCELKTDIDNEISCKCKQI